MRRFREAFLSRSFYAVVLSIILALGVGVALAALTDNLKGHWRLNEASGTRVDAHGNNDLADNNTVTSTAGKIGDAAVFVRANSEYLSIGADPDLTTGDIDFALVIWVYLASKPSGDMYAVAKGNAGGNIEYRIYWEDTADRFIFEISTDGSLGSAVSVTASTFGAPSTATWYFIYAYHDSVGNELGISVNDGTVDTTAHTGGVASISTGFHIGSAADPTNYWDGRIDSTSFWWKVLTSQEVTDLYNGGSGFDYPFTTAAAERSYGVIIYNIPAAFPLGGLW